MSGFSIQELSVRERRFIRSALWQSKASPQVATVCLLLGTTSALAAVALGLGSRSTFAAVVLALTSFGLIGLGGVLRLRERRRRMPDALIALNRCGACGHDLKGARRIESRGVDVRTCSECGCNWTNLDRRFSIEQVYGTR
ncbi:MAG: hypothetical protein CBC35_10740 [Planctomycetes bacterium TMED75]|nr:hypothetical protein [Planctomycetaceae bacterium]OUU90877.1 MAG: hypothetical protein CBC35_10740 [Planctomycetes bacterium TMED75]